MLITREELIRFIESLEQMTALARQWERFSGTPYSTTPEIQNAEDLVRHLRARAS